MEHAQAIFFYLSLLLFVGTFYWAWQRLCVDWSRQLLFEERDKLFLIARSGKIPIDSELYSEVRALLDGIIRFCHQIKWPRLLLSRFRKHDEQVSRQAARVRFLIDAIEDSNIRREIKGIIVRTAFACVVCLMGRSLVLGPIFLFLYLLHRIRDYHDSGTTQQVFKVVQAEAEAYRSDIAAMVKIRT